MLLALKPENGCVINDVNEALINTYRVIRDASEHLLSILSNMDAETCSQEVYLKHRMEYNHRVIQGTYDIMTAALFIWLNKHCFNGLYRVNRKGEFNVPWNKVPYVRSVDPQNIMALSSFLGHIDIHCGDFATAVTDAGPGDFVFFDSPYAPLEGGSFESYTKDRFSKVEHERLAELFQDLTGRGCFCMATNHNTEFVRELYSGFNIEAVSVRRAINSDASKRTGQEIIVTNYKIWKGERDHVPFIIR